MRNALILILLFAACKPSRDVVTRRELPPRGPERVLDSVLLADTVSVRYYSAKAEVDIRDTSGSQGFKAHIRSVLDSAAWVSITPALGIEVARVLITADSLKMMDKLNDHFWVGDTAAAKIRFGLQPSLELLQRALLGKPIGLDPKEKYRSDREDGQYTLTSKERRRFVRAADDLAPEDTLAEDHDMRERRMERTLERAGKRDAIVFKYWIDPDTWLVSRILITDLAHDQQADVRYMERTDANGRYLPTHITLSLSDASRKVSGELTLGRIEFDGPLQLNFRIPEKFTPLP